MAKIVFKPDRIQLPYIERQGQRIEYERAKLSAYANAKIGGREFDWDEGEFKGGSGVDEDGYEYDPPIPLKAVLTNIQDVIHFLPQGEIKTGDIYGGFAWQVPLAFHDRITVMGRRVEKELVFTMGSVPSQMKSYKIVELLEARTTSKTYKPYIDFNTDTDNNIIWSGVSRPSLGENFVIKLAYRPMYVIWQVLVMDRISEDQRIMRRAVLRHYDPLTKTE